ncbi:unnamed protein product [Owenia fusiformis]|uniref:Uncharacterized protein n=1 Tax=Owenia fusiformis TaxID=6347 RepID=A0A8S4Q8B1_OWEFU|nr:unnamed protein product [Owenia fusiformis]
MMFAVMLIVGIMSMCAYGKPLDSPDPYIFPPLPPMPPFYDYLNPDIVEYREGTTHRVEEKYCMMNITYEGQPRNDLLDPLEACCILLYNERYDVDNTLKWTTIDTLQCQRTCRTISNVYGKPIAHGSLPNCKNVDNMNDFKDGLLYAADPVGELVQRMFNCRKFTTREKCKMSKRYFYKCCSLNPDDIAYTCPSNCTKHIKL